MVATDDAARTRRRRESQVSDSRQDRRTVMIIGAVIAGVGALFGGWIATRLLIRGVRTARRTARFAFAAATLRLYRRCPDCRGLHRSDARVCRHCGYRRQPRPRGRRARRAARHHTIAH
jgi:hypothetical protein